MLRSLCSEAERDNFEADSKASGISCLARSRQRKGSPRRRTAIVGRDSTVLAKSLQLESRAKMRTLMMYLESVTSSNSTYRPPPKKKEKKLKTRTRWCREQVGILGDVDPSPSLAKAVAKSRRYLNGVSRGALRVPEYAGILLSPRELVVPLSPEAFVSAAVARSRNMKSRRTSLARPRYLTDDGHGRGFPFLEGVFIPMSGTCLPGVLRHLCGNCPCPHDCGPPLVAALSWFSLSPAVIPHR